MCAAGWVVNRATAHLDNSEPGSPDSEAKVDVLRTIEDRLVEPADLLECLSPEHLACADAEVYVPKRRASLAWHWLVVRASVQTAFDLDPKRGRAARAVLGRLAGEYWNGDADRRVSQWTTQRPEAMWCQLCVAV
jgi:hypothetical protein